MIEDIQEAEIEPSKMPLFLGEEEQKEDATGKTKRKYEDKVPF